MAHQVEIDHIKNILLSESVCRVKEEQCENDDKVDVFPTVVSVDNVKLKDDTWQSNSLRQYEISTSLNNIKTELSTSDQLYPIINENIKMEREINDGDIKIKFDNGLLYCENCRAYYKDYCVKCGMLVHILNKNILSDTDNKVQKQLPNDILVIQKAFGQSGIFALKTIPEGVKFGPFTGLSGSECPLKIKGGKFVVSKYMSKYLNWMQYINPARNSSEQNLHVLQCENNIYYESTCPILEGDELLVFFGEDNEDNLNKDSEMDFIPAVEHILKDTFACTFCCMGFSTKLYLAKHKTTCLASTVEDLPIQELTQCPSCKIHLDRNEYIKHHMAYCWKRKFLPPTLGDQTSDVNERITRRRQTYKCPQCKYTTKYKGDLNRHANKHNEVKSYKCGSCNKRSKTKASVRHHEANTHAYAAVKADPERSIGDYTNPEIKTEALCSPVDVKQFNCPQCEFRTNYKLRLKGHITSKHLKGYNYKCDSCGYKAKHKSLLKAHIKTKHLNESDYSCDKCDYKTNRKANLECHRKAKHLKEFNYKCESCTYKTYIKSNLDRHVQAKHLHEFNHKCDLCEYKSSRRESLEVHIKSVHLKEYDYACDMCAYKTNRKSDLKRHIKTKHLNEFVHKCDLCHYKIYDKSKLECHIKTKHLYEFDYKCQSCSYKTCIKSHLESHIKRKHRKEFDYKCESCDYKVNDKSNLENHIKTKHLKEFDYKCGTCDYKINDKSKLESHIKTKHLKKFDFKCSLCTYETCFKSNLESHIKTKHLKEFDYKCDSCDYKVNQKSKLESHIKTKHLKEFDYKCEMCDYKINEKSRLECHIKTKHLKEFDYECQMCDFKVNQKSKLNSHMKTKHLKQFDVSFNCVPVKRALNQT